MSFLYEKIAGELSQAIDKGVFPPGTRLPSIRSTQKHYGVSVATVMEAFARLEVKGVVEVRPKSGHFVRSPTIIASQPEQTRPNPRPGLVSVTDLAMEVLSLGNQKYNVPLGASVPSRELLPLDTLARFHTRAAPLHRMQMGRYEDPKGTPDLRQAIVKLATESGAILDPESVVITNGAQEALNLGLRAVTSPEDIVAVESPTYFGVLQAIEALGLRALELPTHPLHGIDLQALEKAAEAHSISACVLAPTCQNPLGYNMSDDAKRSVVETLTRNGIPLIEDDVWGTLGLDHPRPLVAKSFDQSDNVMLCSSFSKTVSPGLRLGWIAPGKYFQQVLRQKFLANISTGFVQQKTMEGFLDGNRFRRTTQAAATIYAQRLRKLRSAVLDKFPQGTRCTTPQGGFFLWVELPGEYDTLALFRLASRKGISFTPGRLFSRTNIYGNCLRLSCGILAENEIDAAVNSLAKLLPKCINKSLSVN